MKVNIEPGRYIVAVSGGVDSVTLLDLLAQQDGLELIVAHFNHGIRADADKDAQLVAKLSKTYELPVEVGYGYLRANASEESARKARYEFLENIQKKYNADRIVTAHHQDDLIETALINLIRGTGYRGLNSIQSNKSIFRPLIKFSKNEILNYAKKNNLVWRDDASNKDDRYLRNYIRNNILANLDDNQRDEFISNIDKVAKTDNTIRYEIAKLPQLQDEENYINRAYFTQLPIDVGREVLAHMLREREVRDFDRKTIDRLNIAIRTAKAGTRQPVKTGLNLIIGPEKANFSLSV
jgi:tRNA(Ile)-lysidine synthase